MDLRARYADAAAAYGTGRYAEALSGFSALVELRHAPAATDRAAMFVRAEGVAHNLPLCEPCCRKPPPEVMPAPRSTWASFSAAATTVC
jgi:hypothetical protein